MYKNVCKISHWLNIFVKQEKDGIFSQFCFFCLNMICLHTSWFTPATKVAFFKLTSRVTCSPDPLPVTMVLVTLFSISTYTRYILMTYWKKGQNWIPDLKVPKCEIFDHSDFHDFYTIKPFWVGGFGLKYKTCYFNFWGTRHHLISAAHGECAHQFLTRMLSARISSWCIYSVMHKFLMCTLSACINSLRACFEGMHEEFRNPK